MYHQLKSVICFKMQKSGGKKAQVVTSPVRDLVTGGCLHIINCTKTFGKEAGLASCIGLMQLQYSSCCFCFTLLLRKLCFAFVDAFSFQVDDLNLTFLQK